MENVRWSQLIDKCTTQTRFGGHYAEVVSVELGEENKNQKTRIVLKLFGSDSLTLGHKKLGKFVEKVMEFEEFKRVRTLLWSSVINIQRG